MRHWPSYMGLRVHAPDSSSMLHLSAPLISDSLHLWISNREDTKTNQCQFLYTSKFSFPGSHVALFSLFHELQKIAIK